MPRRNSAESRPATKADVQRLDKKIDGSVHCLDKKIDAFHAELKGDFRRLAAVQVRMQDDIRSIRREMSTKEDINRVLSAIDAFAQKAEAYDRKTLSHPAMLQDHGARLQDHERRIGRLESR